MARRLVIYARRVSSRLPSRKSDEEKVEFPNKVFMATQVYIKPNDIEQFGMTRGCPRCDHHVAYGPAEL